MGQPIGLPLIPWWTETQSYPDVSPCVGVRLINWVVDVENACNLQF